MNPLKDSFVRIVKEWNKLPNHLFGNDTDINRTDSNEI